MPWLIDHMQNRIDNALSNQYMKSFNITLSHDKEVGCGVVNELIGRLLIQDIHPDGLDQIKFSSFTEKVELLN